MSGPDMKQYENIFIHSYCKAGQDGHTKTLNAVPDDCTSINVTNIDITSIDIIK